VRLGHVGRYKSVDEKAEVGSTGECQSALAPNSPERVGADGRSVGFDHYLYSCATADYAFIHRPCIQQTPVLPTIHAYAQKGIAPAFCLPGQSTGGRCVKNVGVLQGREVQPKESVSF
jgi:hypothetical protein